MTTKQLKEVKKVKIENSNFIRESYIRKSLKNSEEFLISKRKEAKALHESGEIHRGLYIHKKLILDGQIKQCRWFLGLMELHPTCYPNPLEWKEKGVINDSDNSLKINVLQTIDNQAVMNRRNFLSKIFGNIK